MEKLQIKKFEDDEIVLIEQLKHAERELFDAREKMNNVIEDDLIDYYIYEVKALEIKYGFLLKKVKEIS